MATAAAMRYTGAYGQSGAGAARRYRQGHCHFQDNYDNSEREPVVLARFQFVVNGANGIAVGMATNVRRNLGELVDAAQALIVNAELATKNCCKSCRTGFPDRCAILGQNGSKSAVMTGARLSCGAARR